MEQINPKAKPTYFNRPQLMAQLIGARTTVIVAGRRTGKTDSIAAPYTLKMMQRMPGSTGGIVVPTFKHGLTNTLPGLFAAWERWGYKKGIHYVVGRRPPKSFAKPITEPHDWEQVIAFYNGSVAVILSQDRTGAANSLTLSWLLIDEAKFIDPVRLHNETFPANGGIKTHFSRHSFNHAVLILSDMPQSKKGSWFLEYEKKMDPKIIRAMRPEFMSSGGRSRKFSSCAVKAWSLRLIFVTICAALMRISTSSAIWLLTIVNIHRSRTCSFWESSTFAT